MGQVSDYRPAPYQGVSQAPPQVRLKEQAEQLEDCLVAIPQGCTKRPPFTWVGKLASHSGATNGIFERVPRSPDEGDRILTITSEEGVGVPLVHALSDLSSEAVTVDTAAQAYLNEGLTLPDDDLGVTTVVDFTFVTNRNVIVENDAAALEPSRNPEAMIWVRQGAYGRTYKVTVSPSGGTPVTVTLTTPDGSTATSASLVGTDTIAASLISGSYSSTDGASISGNLSGLSSQGFTVTRVGSVVYLTDAGDFTVAVEDDQGGAAMLAIKGSVQRFSDLPAKSVNGFVVKVAQRTETDQDDYFMRYDQTAGSGTGVWTECLEPGAELGVDPETLPMALTPDGSGGWDLAPASWKQRTVGNETLIPDPDFIGQSIQDLTYWRGRLALIAGEGCILAASDDPFRLYPRTLTQVLDSDPIQRTNPSPGATLFRYAIPFESRLVLFGQSLQCQVTASGEVVKPSSCDIDEMTSHEFSDATYPLKANGKLYFLAPRGETSKAVYELQIDLVTNVAGGEDLSGAIPRYLPATINRSAVCPVNYMAAYGTSGERPIYVHLFRWANGERVQNGYMRWWLPEGWGLGGMFFKNTSLYVLACRAGEAHLLVCDLSPGVLDPSSDILLTHLDFRLTETQASSLTYDAPSDRTTIKLPYPRSDDVRVTVRAPGGEGGVEISEGVLAEQPEGVAVEIDWEASEDAADDEVVLVGDWSDCPLWAGLQYEKRWRLSTIYMLDGENQPITTGRLQQRKLVFDIAETGYLRAEVRVAGRAPRSYEFQGYTLDDPSSILDTPPNATREFAVPCWGRNSQVIVDIINDSHFGDKELGYTWTGEFNAKATRV